MYSEVAEVDVENIAEAGVVQLKRELTLFSNLHDHFELVIEWLWRAALERSA